MGMVVESLRGWLTKEELKEEPKVPSFWAVEIAVEGRSLAEEEKAEDLRMAEADEEAIFL